MQPALEALLDLFRTELRDVQFPDVDASSLLAHQQAVESASAALEAAEQAVARATAELAERKQALAQHGKRALAYVKIYAEEHPAVRERLEHLQDTRKPAGESGEPKRRGRPRKQEVSEPLVFEVGAAQLAS